MRKGVLGFIAAMAAAAVTGPAGASSANQGYEWFWGEVPARIAAGSRDGALQVVLDAGSDSRTAAALSARSAAVLDRWWDQITVAAQAARVSEALIAALVLVESAGRADAISPVGARGLGQLMPGTAHALGVRDSFDPAENLRGAALYLSDLLDMFGGDLVLALAAYNAGEGAVMRHGGVPPFRETRGYVPKVLAAFVHTSSWCENANTLTVRSACRRGAGL